MLRRHTQRVNRFFLLGHDSGLKSVEFTGKVIEPGRFRSANCQYAKLLLELSCILSAKACPWRTRDVPCDLTGRHKRMFCYVSQRNCLTFKRAPESRWLSLVFSFHTNLSFPKFSRDGMSWYPSFFCISHFLSSMLPSPHPELESMCFSRLLKLVDLTCYVQLVCHPTLASTRNRDTTVPLHFQAVRLLYLFVFATAI